MHATMVRKLRRSTQRERWAMGFLSEDRRRQGPRRTGPAPPFWVRPELGRTKYVCRLFLCGHIFFGAHFNIGVGHGNVQAHHHDVGRRRRLKFSFFPGQEKCIITTVIRGTKSGIRGQRGEFVGGGELAGVHDTLLAVFAQRCSCVEQQSRPSYGGTRLCWGGWTCL